MDDANLEILKNVKKIIFACEAGMGSSAMGAGIVRKMLKEEDIKNILVTNCAIKDLPPNSEVVICQNIFRDLVVSKFPDAYVYTVEQFLIKTDYTNFISDLKKAKRETKNDN
ncbi:MAG: PTS mannitol (MtlA)-like IIB domain protein [Bacilli bacterium]